MPTAGAHLVFLVTEDWYFVSHRLYPPCLHCQVKL